MTRRPMAHSKRSENLRTLSGLLYLAIGLLAVVVVRPLP